MAPRQRARRRALIDLVGEACPDEDAAAVIAGGSVLVNGIPVTNPRSLVRAGTAIELRQEQPLRGERKLKAALDVFGVSVAGRVALDLGASAGGFTRALLTAGAARVYAVDAGFGQLLGSLRQHPGVVNLERTNLTELTTALVPDAVEVVTADLSYVSLATALPQLAVELDADADLVAVVKPQFELGLPARPMDSALLEGAGGKAAEGARAAGWRVRGLVESPIRGAAGAIELFLHAQRGWPASPSSRPAARA